MDYVLSKFKIVDGKLEETKKFLSNLHLLYQTEMTEVLKESNMYLDCSFIDETQNGNYLFIFKKLEKNELLRKNLKSSKLAIYDQIRDWADEMLIKEKNIDSIATFDAG